jgi:phosphoglycolate phosphatase-like HAD superfamily hydrolase
LQNLQAKSSRCQQHIAQQQETLIATDEWLASLEADNMVNPNPVTSLVRIDAGFSTGLNLTWLIELGYLVLTKAHHGSSTDCLRRTLPAQVQWTVVGKNAEAVAMGAYQQHECPYPWQAMLVRYHLPEKIRYTTLFYYGDSPPPALPDWFDAYNARQTIEAGIKEEKGVLTLKRHLVRSPIGMQLQEQFAPLLTITAPNVDKGSGLRALCASLGIDVNDAVAIGDSEVDIPMFRVAGTSIAMANGTGAAIGTAAHRTFSADHDGVAAYLESIL